LDTINEVVKTEFPAERNLSGVSGNYDVIAGKSAVSILVAHDSDLSRAVAEKTLALLGHNFDIVANTSELLMKSRTGKFDLILTDVQSERVDGIAAARQLVKHFGLKNMPVIIGVSDDVERDRSVCLQAGMSDVIVKPLKPEAVEGHIHRWFEA
jgi:CheY-like chemotaxis protein